LNAYQLKKRTRQTKVCPTFRLSASRIALRSQRSRLKKQTQVDGYSIFKDLTDRIFGAAERRDPFEEDAAPAAANTGLKIAQGHGRPRMEKWAVT
jgi:hypothetical protein